MNVLQHFLPVGQLRIGDVFAPLVRDFAVIDNRGKIVDLADGGVDKRGVGRHFFQCRRFAVGTQDGAGFVIADQEHDAKGYDQ
ncbi:hypothetical protein D3C81_1544590 [compost metagenome]